MSKLKYLLFLICKWYVHFSKNTLYFSHYLTLTFTRCCFDIKKTLKLNIISFTYTYIFTLTLLGPASFLSSAEDGLLKTFFILPKTKSTLPNRRYKNKKEVLKSDTRNKDAFLPGDGSDRSNGSVSSTSL